MDLALRRRFYAEEIEAVARLQTSALVEALAVVPRERFLPPGPWTVLSEIDFAAGTSKARTTTDADPARVYHNIGIAIDPSRQLFNGQPATLASWVDGLALTRGARVMHVGCGLGYYTALIAHCVGASGTVLATEAEATLAAAARANLAERPWVTVSSTADGDPACARFDAILINAGVTHPLPAWLDALTPGGRMILPLTASMGAGSTIGKGVVLLITREGDDSYTARVTGIVAIYSAVGLRDETLAASLGKAMMLGPIKWAAVSRLRTDTHERAPSCWYHTAAFCLSS